MYVMEEKNYTGVVPHQEKGVPIDTSATVELESMEAAKSFFETVKNRLLHVNNWHKIAGDLSAIFQLTDELGNEVEEEAKEGYYFKIDIPGPGPTAGKGYDWVKIEAIENILTPDVESVGIRVRPAPNPLNRKADIAHFYAEEATSNFTVTREGKKVTAAIYDRNTQPNNETASITDKIRDTIVGTASILLFSKLQWKSLTEGLLKRD
jgi:hypothetical protein